MNKILEKYARQWLLENIAKLPEENRKFFMRLYSSEVSWVVVWQDVVNGVKKEKLDFMMVQVENSLKKQ